MPYDIKRNYGGCSGYAVVGPSGSHGCHKTRREAIQQQRALYAAEGDSKKSHDGAITNEDTPNKKPHSMEECTDPKNCPDHMEDDMDKKSPCWDGYVQRGMKPGKGGRMVPNCVPVKKAEDMGCCPDLEKAEEWEGKELYDKLSQAEKELADSLLNLADTVGALDKARGIWVGYESGQQNENATIGVKCGNCALHKSSVACAILEMPIEEEGACRFAVIPDGYVNVDSDVRDDMDNPDHEDDMSKRSLEDLDLRPTESMASNARRGLELRRKFGRGGTAVGVARARDLANRKELSPGTVLRMYSFFSRHEVDKQGKDWNNSERPSNGKIAWLLWGGDSGYAWAKSKRNAIMNVRSKKSNDAVWESSAFAFKKTLDN